MTTPNPMNVFGRRQSPRTPESPVTPDHIDKELIIYAAPEMTTDESARARAINHTLGNHELPIAQYREQIVSAVDASQAVVITAETGAGKSTQVPQFLAEQGYEVVVTQPRVVAARSVAERVRDEIVAEKGSEYAAFVGHRTARERNDSPENQILFVTDGLQLVRELSGNGAGKKQALVLDEVHEWNENMEVLVAWAKQRMQEDPDFKVVTMSATMEADKLSRYFADEGKREVPVIEVPGRTYEVKKSEGGDVAGEAIKLAKDGKNTLVFVPGKAEIDQVMAEVTRANIPSAVILSLHGQLEKEEQRKVFKKYPGAKVIVATNVAQTSITIEDIDAVVDSGLERQNQVKNGVEGLYLNPISQADCLQRAGRAGRTKAGEYVLAQLGNNKLVPMAEREAYGTPEILRTRLDGMVLRLAKGGLDAAELEFYHQPDHADIAKAKTRLQKLGALREDGSITKVGRDMDRMPVESHYARMMIEARQYGPEVQMQLAAMLAVQEAGGICQFGTKNRPCDERWRGLLAPDMNDSDAIKQLEVFVAAERMSDSQKRNHDIYTKAFSKSREVLRQLRGVEKLHAQDLSVPTKEQREQLVKCIIAGMVDSLYIGDGYYGGHRNAQGEMRELSQRSMIRAGRMVVGKPFDLQINTRRGLTTLHLLEGPTNVPSVEVLREVAPQLFSEKSQGYTLNTEGVVMEQFTQIFNGHDTGEIATYAANESAERTEYLARKITEQQWHSGEVQQIIKTITELNDRMPGAVGVITFDNLYKIVAETMPRNVATLEAAMEYVPQFSLDDLVSPQERAAIYVASPSEYGGRALAYKNGLPMLSDSMSDDEILELVADEWVLPDGRKVGLRDYWNGNAVDMAEQQVRILKARAERAERERQEHERRVESAVSYFEQGYSLEQITGWVGDKTSSEAHVIYEAKMVEREAAERAESERRRLEAAEAAARQEAAMAQVSQLIILNDDLYDSTRLTGLDDAQKEIVDDIEAIRVMLDDINNELNLGKERIVWGHTVAVDAYAKRMESLRARLTACTQKFTDWQEEQKTRGNQPASEADLAALMTRFNKR